MLLNENALAVWKELEKSGPLDIGRLVERTGLDQSQVSAAAAEASEQGYFEIRDRPREELIPSEDARESLSTGLPERRAAQRLAQEGGQIALKEFIKNLHARNCM